MAKKIRFPLEMADGAQVRNLEDFQEHFDLVTVLEYYKNGKLLTWLQDRYFDDEAAAVAALDETAPDLQPKLCDIFGVAYTGEAVDLEEISRRQERLERLRAFTDEAEFIDHIDQVAFDQEELADLLDEGTATIYLCGEKFTVPVSRKGMTYIGVNSPGVHISGKLPENANELDIEFVACAVDNLPASDKQAPADTLEQIFSSDFRTDKVTEDLVNEIMKSADAGDMVWGIVRETSNFIVYRRNAYKRGSDSGRESYEILFDKRTGEKKRLPKDFPGVRGNCVDGDRVFYFEEDKYAHDSSRGNIWSIDLTALAVPEKLFPVHCDKEDISVCCGHIAYIDSDTGPAVYDVQSKTMSKIPVKNGYYCAIYATAEGVYFSSGDSPYTLNFYDYASKKVIILFESKNSINKIYHVEADSLFYIQTDSKCVKIDISTVAEGGKATSSTIFDVMETDYSGHGIYAYNDCLIFVAKGGIIKSVDYKTGEAKELAADAYEHHYDSGGLFRKSSSRDTPVLLNRIGNWIVYYQNGDYEKMCIVSLEHPGEIKFISKFDYNKNGFEEELAFLEETYDIPELKIE